MTKEIEIPEGYEARIEDNKVIFEPKESEDERIRKELIETIRWIKEGRFPTAVQIQKSSSWIAWLEKQGEKMSDPRYSILDKLIEADDIYQMSVNDTMVEEAKNKAIEALSKLEISKLLRLEKQGKKEYALKSFKDEDVRKFMQYIEKEAKAYEFNLPNRGYDIYAFAKDILYWLEKQDEQKPTDKVEPKFKVGDEIKLAKEPKYPARKIITIKNDAYYFDELVYLSFIHQDEWELVKQKPIDKIEPKFKVGDWVSNGHCKCQITFIDSRYWYSETRVLGDTTSIDKTFHLWTIQDAKDGDVLAFDDENIVIFKDLYNSTTFHSYCRIEDGIFDISKDDMPDWWEGEGFYPATKEQRDFLFQKMKEAGYEWDDEKKELKKIEQKPADIPEDFERLVEHLLSLSDGEGHGSPAKVKEVSSELLRLANQQKTAWSEEDEMMLKEALRMIEKPGSMFKGEILTKKVADWLRFLKDRVQPKQEWSEEDSEKLTRIYQFIWANRKGDTDEIYQQEQDADWLMKLKPNHWKPTSL